jgi:ubiquitin C-terminal hydrolase
MSALGLDRPTLEWAWKFINMGGSEHVADTLSMMINQCEEQVVTSNCEFLRSLGGGHGDGKEGRELGVSRGDAFVLSLSYGMRIMHKLLMLDPMYNKWQTDSPAARSALFVGEDMSAHIPPGAVLTCFQTEEFVSRLMTNLTTIVARSAASAGSTESQEANGGAISPLQTLIEHSIVLIFGMLATTDRCVAIVSQYADFCRFIRAVTLRAPGRCVRRAAGRRIVECCTVLLMKCRNDVTSSLLASEKMIRVRLFHYVLHCSVACAHPGFTSSSQGSSMLLGSAQSPSALAKLGVNSSLRAPERYRSAGETYGLIACLLTLRSRPQVMTARTNVGSFQDLCGSKEKLLAANSTLAAQRDFDGVEVPWTEEKDLCELFVEKLFTHHSQESHLSSEPDGTLVGILHMLLVLAHSSEGLVLLGQIQLPVMLFHGDASPREKAGLIRFLFANCLFPSGDSAVGTSAASATVAVCQTPHSRHLAYALLLTLCRSHVDHMRCLVKIMVPQVTISKRQSHITSASPSGPSHFADESSSALPLTPLTAATADDIRASRRGQSRKQQWEYDPNVLVKAHDAFLGLVNQGATCYMNAFLQQLYHTKRFANGLLAVDSRDTSDPENEQVLFELQVLFGYLRLSQKNYCDTISFCKTLKDYDGEPIKLGEQKDANEFAGMLFEKLEANRACTDLLKRCFGGQLVWQTISTESSYRSEREEPYYMLTAEVKDKASLEDSLELYVAGELLTGDNKIEDSESGKKVDALRRCAVRTLPEVLILHLKRFEFNLETMNRRKLNDLFTFPTDLDMLPYTEEGIQQAESKRRARSLSNSRSEDLQAMQDLVEAVKVEGVVSAMEDPDRIGLDAPEPEEATSDDDATPVPTASGAQALKAIKERSYYQYQLKGIVAHTGAIDSGHYYSFIKQSDTGKWLEFNDRSVLPFDEESIPTECFGGPSENANGTLTMKAHGAYMLFYERRDSSGNIGAVHSSPTTSGSGGNRSGNHHAHQAVVESLLPSSDYAIEDKKDRKANYTRQGSRDDNLPPSSTRGSALLPAASKDEEEDSGDDADSSDDEAPAKKHSISSTGTSKPKAIPKASVPVSKKPKALEMPSSAQPKTFPAPAPGVELTLAAPVMEDLRIVRRNRTESMLSDCEGWQHLSNWKASVVGSAWSDMSDLVVRAIWAENTEFVLDKARFSVEYFLFYAKLLQVPLIAEILNDISLADDVLREGALATNERSSLADYVSTIISYDISSGSVLARLVVSSFEFCVNVLARGRAHQCLPFFVERLEEIIMRDSVGICAEVLLTELAKDPEEGDLPVSPARTSHSAGDLGPYSSTRQKERLKVERSVHPLLIAIFVECPHTFTISSLSRLLMWCVKVLRPSHSQKYVESSIAGPSASTTHGAGLASSPPSYVEMFQQREQQQEECSHYVSCVSRFIGKLLLLLEYFRPEDAIEQMGKSTESIFAVPSQ